MSAPRAPGHDDAPGDTPGDASGDASGDTGDASGDAADGGPDAGGGAADTAGGPAAIRSARAFRRFALAVSALGVLVQLALGAYYLGMGHAPTPHRLPVGVVGSPEQQAQVTSALRPKDGYRVTAYQDAGALAAAIKVKDAYGGVDLSGERPRLFVATAAGPSVATLLRGTFTTVVQQRTAEQVKALAAQGAPVPVSTLQALSAPPAVTDVVPLPAPDRAGAAIGFLVQALAIGGTVASTGLGQLIPRTRRSYRRGLGHATTLVVYAASSAAAVLWVMGWFGLAQGAKDSALFLEFALLSLAITASTAGSVALFGQAGALLGLVYFTVGIIISGASIAPELLPAAGRLLGQALPPGAGATAIRDSLYFPAVSTTGPLSVLALYAVLGLAVVLVTNMLPNRSGRTSEMDIRLASRLSEDSRSHPANRARRKAQAAPPKGRY